MNSVCVDSGSQVNVLAMRTLEILRVGTVAECH